MFLWIVIPLMQRNLTHYNVTMQTLDTENPLGKLK